MSQKSSILEEYIQFITQYVLFNEYTNNTLILFNVLKTAILKMVNLHSVLYQCIVILILVVLYEWSIVRVIRNRRDKSKSQSRLKKQLHNSTTTNEILKRKKSRSNRLAPNSHLSSPKHRVDRKRYKPLNESRYPFTNGLSTINELAEQNGNKNYSFPDDGDWVGEDSPYFSYSTSPPPPVSTPVGFEPSSPQINSQVSHYYQQSEWNNNYWHNSPGGSPPSTSATLNSGETSYYNNSKRMSIQRNMDSLDLGKLDEAMKITMRDRMPLDIKPSEGESDGKTENASAVKSTTASSPEAELGSLFISQEKASAEDEVNTTTTTTNNYINFRNFQKNPGVITGLQVSSSSVYWQDRNRQIRNHKRRHHNHHHRRHGHGHGHAHGHGHRHGHRHGHSHRHKHHHRCQPNSHNGSSPPPSTTNPINLQITPPLTGSISSNGSGGTSATTTTTTSTSTSTSTSTGSDDTKSPVNIATTDSTVPTTAGETSIPDPEQQLGKLEAYVGMLKQQFKQGGNEYEGKGKLFKRRKKIYWYRKLWSRLRGEREKWTMMNEVK